jgi:hypothetical protein
MKKQILIYVLMAVMLTSCARGCQDWNRKTVSNHAQNVRVSLYSGGEVVKVWEFHGIVNNDANSIFFYYEGKLVEVDGDVLIEYLD